MGNPDWVSAFNNKLQNKNKKDFMMEGTEDKGKGEGKNVCVQQTRDFLNFGPASYSVTFFVLSLFCLSVSALRGVKPHPRVGV